MEQKEDEQKKSEVPMLKRRNSKQQQDFYLEAFNQPKPMEMERKPSFFYDIQVAGPPTESEVMSDGDSEIGSSVLDDGNSVVSDVDEMKFIASKKPEQMMEAIEEQKEISLSSEREEEATRWNEVELPMQQQKYDDDDDEEEVVFDEQTSPWTVNDKLDEPPLATQHESPKVEIKEEEKKENPALPELKPRAAPGQLLRTLSHLVPSRTKTKRHASPGVSASVRALRSAHGLFDSIAKLGWILLNDLNTQQFAAYLLTIFSLLSECTIPSPRYNFAIGTILISLPIKYLRHRMSVSGLCFVILLDIFWLMRPSETIYEGVTFATKPRSFANLTVAICLIVKIWLVASVYFNLPERQDEGSSPSKPQRPPHVHHKTLLRWSSLKHFFPRQTLPKRSELAYTVLCRTVAILFIHVVTGIVLLGIACCASLGYSQSRSLHDQTFGLSMLWVMYIKVSTIAATLIIVSPNIDYRNCIHLYGCHRLLPFAIDRSNNSTKPFINYERKWLKRVQIAKTIDAFVGLYLVLVVFSASHVAVYHTVGERIILTLVQLLLLILDGWGLLLILIVCRCGKSLHEYYSQRQRDPDLKSEIYLPRQLHQFAVEDNSDSDEESEDDSSSEDDSDDTDEEEDSEDGEFEMNFAQEWDQSFGQYDLSYRRTSMSNLTSPLSCDIHYTLEDFERMWESYPVVGQIACAIQAMPHATDFYNHLAYHRFFIAKEMEDETSSIRYIYCYATFHHLSETVENPSFLIEFIFDQDHYTLHAHFKSVNDYYVKDYVQLLELKQILGDYSPLTT